MAKDDLWFTMLLVLQGIGLDLPWMCKCLGTQHVQNNSSRKDR